MSTKLTTSNYMSPRIILINRIRAKNQQSLGFVMPKLPNFNKLTGQAVTSINKPIIKSFITILEKAEAIRDTMLAKYRAVGEEPSEKILRLLAILKKLRAGLTARDAKAEAALAKDLEGSIGIAPMLVAGVAVTAVGVSWAVVNLAKVKAVYKQLQNEDARLSALVSASKDGRSLDLSQVNSGGSKFYEKKGYWVGVLAALGLTGLLGYKVYGD